MFKKFVTSELGTPAQKRKQAPQACENCKKRKKRCDHHQSSPSATHTDETTRSSRHQRTAGASPTLGLVYHTTSPDVPSIETPTSPIVRQLRNRENENASPRFIGDLNPESVFQAAECPETTRGAKPGDSVGIWLGSKPRDVDSRTLEPRAIASIFHGLNSPAAKALLSSLEAEVMATIPKQDIPDTLAEAYLEKIHPLFPAIDMDYFRNLAHHDPERILLCQAMCLAVSKLPGMSSHLFPEESMMAPRKLANAIFAAMRLSVELGNITNKDILIQALVIMSHFSDGPECADVASQLCARAVHYAHTIGLHLPGQDSGAKEDANVTLLCCVWAIDRMNAAFHGRPVMMHERDFGRSLGSCFAKQEPPFRLFLATINLLDQVIGLYRPASMSDTSVPIIFPPFEELVTQSGAVQTPTVLLGTVEILYNAVAILSHRSRATQSPEPSSSSTARIRQDLACSRIRAMVTSDYNDQLVFFPFLPYAVSLSMSVAYRELRYSRIPMLRARAGNDFQTCCKFLSDIGEIFWSAKMMSDMGRATIKEMDRVITAAVGVEEAGIPSVLINGTNHTGTSADPSAGKIVNGIQTPGEQHASDSPFPVPEFDPSLFESIADLDLFGMFDPQLDLSSIDAYLSGNLDLSFPSNFQ